MKSAAFHTLGCKVNIYETEAMRQALVREGYEIRTVNITNISRGHSMEALRHNIDTVKNVLSATRDAKKIIDEFQPDVAIGTGGYVCYPVLKAANERHVPTAVHESNAVPGLTTKMLAGQVDRIMLGFEESRQYYRNQKDTIVTGTPVRGEFDKYTKEEAKRQLNIPEGMPLVVSVWGSLGASHMNGIMSELIREEHADPGYRLIHATGRNGKSGAFPLIRYGESEGEFSAVTIQGQGYVRKMTLDGVTGYWYQNTPGTMLLFR